MQDYRVPFSGGDPCDFVRGYEEFFKINPMIEVDMIQYVMQDFEGEALGWYFEYVEENFLDTWTPDCWEDFVAEMYRKFQVPKVEHQVFDERPKTESIEHSNSTLVHNLAAEILAQTTVTDQVREQKMLTISENNRDFKCLLTMVEFVNFHQVLRYDFDRWSYGLSIGLKFGFDPGDLSQLIKFLRLNSYDLTNILQTEFVHSNGSLGSCGINFLNDYCLWECDTTKTNGPIAKEEVLAVRLTARQDDGRPFRRLTDFIFHDSDGIQQPFEMLSLEVDSVFIFSLILPLDESYQKEKEQSIRCEGFGRMKTWAISGYENGVPTIWVSTDIANYDCVKCSASYKKLYEHFSVKASACIEVYKKLSKSSGGNHDLSIDELLAGVIRDNDDITCLRILEQMQRRCSYHATTCSQATVALNLLRERKCSFDLVLSDVHMPDMDGFKLLELVGLEMDLPVIMMSADGKTSAVMRGIRHGACNYLIKPIREEELKNIWQHVVRKKWNETKEHENSGSLDDNDRHKRGSDDAEYASSVNEGSEGMIKTQKKRRDIKEEDDGELENDDPTASKKPRVVWSVELHQQFVSAVNQLGIDKAVPKRILELMNVPGLTRENVASHLQKFRLYLKRLSGVAQQLGGIPNSFCGPVEQNPKIGQLGRFDFQALAASGQIPPQTLAALHAELLGRPTGNLVLPAMDQPTLLQAALQGQKCIPVDPGVAYGQPLMKCPSNISKQFSQPIISAEDVHSSFGTWTSNSLGTVGPISNLTGVASQNGNMLMSILQNQQQQQQQQHQHQKQSVLQEPSRSVNVQPSCLVVPSQSTHFQAGNSPASVNQSCSYNRSSVIDYSLIAPQVNNSSFGVEQMSDGDLKMTRVLNGYSDPGPFSPSVSSCSRNVDSGAGQRVQNSGSTFSAARQSPALVPNMNDFQGSYGEKSSQVLGNGPLRNLGFVGKVTSIPSRFAVDEAESSMSNFSHGSIFRDNNGKKVKQEPNLDFIENVNMGNPTLQHFSPNDLTSVFSE